MPIDYARRPLAKVRREDRTMAGEDEIRAMLQRAPYCALATVLDGQPFINTNLFVYDEAAHAIYTHTARAGRTQANVEAGTRACLSVSEMGRLLPHEEALEFSVEYSGVAVFGLIALIRDEDEKREALQLLLDKYFGHLTPGEDYRPITEDELAKTAVYRLTIEQWSGKRKEERPDYPGAFFYGDPPPPELARYRAPDDD